MARTVFISIVVLFAAFSILSADGITVKRVTVDSVSESNQTVTVKFAHSEKPEELKLVSTAVIRLDGATAKLTAIKAGMAAIVQLNSDGEAVQILAHSPKDGSAPAPRTKTPKSKPKTTTHKTAKTAKTSSKSRTKGNSEKSIFDSPSPVATTPLAMMKNPDPKLAAAKGGEWPCFLGPNHDNVSQETGLLQQWPPGGPKLAWRTPGLGVGYSSVSVAGGIVFSMGTPDNQESVLAIGLNDGKALWSVPTGGPLFQESSGNGPRSTPTVDGRRVYALGASGELVAVDVNSKSIVWHKNLPQEFGAPPMRYGYAESVLIDGPRLICTPGGQSATIVALDKDSGNLLWKCQVPTLPQASYASPIVGVVGGTRQYIDFLSRGVAGVRATDGQFLWANDAAANQQAICTTPLFIKDHVFASSSYGAGAALVHLTASEQGTQATLVYHSLEMKNHHGGLVAVDNFVYGADDQVLTCFSLESGRAVWKSRSVGKCSLTCADGHLYVRGEAGGMALVEATPDGYHERGRFMPPKNGTAPAWPYPVVASGKLFLRDQDDLLCYSLRDTK